MARLLKQIQISSTPFILGDQYIVPKTSELPKEDHSYEEGYLKGLAEGTKQAEQDLLTLKQSILALISSIPQALEQARMNLSQEIADIVLHIIQGYFIERHHDPKALGDQINTILNQLNQKQHIELSLHPQDIQMLQSGEMQLDVKNLQGIKIKPSESLHLGGCLITTDHGVFDASIEQQIDALKTILMDLKQGSANAGHA